MGQPYSPQVDSRSPWDKIYGRGSQMAGQMGVMGSVGVGSGGGSSPIDRINFDPVGVQDPDNGFFLQNILGPYREMFAANRGQALAQAKEQAGNLTGSGYNNIFGTALAGSLAGENAQLAQTMMGLRGQQQGFNLQRAQLEQQARAQNAQNFLGLLSGMNLTGVQPNQQVYKPGFLDYAMKGAAMAMPFFTGGAGAASAGTTGASAGAASAGASGGFAGGMAPGQMGFPTIIPFSGS